MNPASLNSEAIDHTLRTRRISCPAGYASVRRYGLPQSKSFALISAEHR